LIFELATDPTIATLVEAAEIEVTNPLIPAKTEFGDLVDGREYFYRVTDGTGATTVGRFRTPPASGEYHGLRFGVSGDWRGELRPYPAISNVVERDLDFFVALGDTIYADFPSVDSPQPQSRTLDDFRVKHNEVYSERFGRNSWAEVRASTAVFACIDDHEVTNDFAGGAPAGSDPRFEESGDFLNESALYGNALQAFHEYNPIREDYYDDTSDPRTAGKRKLYRFRTYGNDAAMFLVDARSFRDEELASPPDASLGDVLAFLRAAFEPSRTMLGGAQRQELRQDLLAAQERGITWKLVMIPEPIQNLGPVLAGDRFEGYAYERCDLLQFITVNEIDNVVFIAADIHGTIVNNLTYQRFAGDRQHSTTAFEITTGPVAFADPFGPTVVDSAPLGFLARPLETLYDRLNRQSQDAVIRLAGDALLGAFGYPRIGLWRSPIHARLLAGRYLSVNTFGWTEFEIDAATQNLLVTTYGIDWYTTEELLADPEAILARTPEIVSQFRVEPKLDRSAIAATVAGSDRPSHAPRTHASPCGAIGSVIWILLPLAWLKTGIRR
jgi:3-phytase/alkaline phosphatase D